MEPNPVSDEALMQRFQSGDQTAFEELFERYAPRLVAFCFRALHGQSEAEDVAQDVMLAIYLKKERFRPDAPFKPWIFTIASHLASKALRRRVRHPTVPLDMPAGDEETLETSGLFPDPKQRTAEAESLVSERNKLIERAILMLPETQRIAVSLLRYEDLSYEEIAQATGQSVASVKSLLFRARKSLQDSLRELSPASLDL